MPIRPSERDRYPADWLAVRESVLVRAGNRCERCGASNHEVIERHASEPWYVTGDGKVQHADTGERLDVDNDEWESGRLVRIVLTVAHLDHSPEHNDPTNLRALCQRCHLRHDAAQHARNARATRRSRGGQLDLPIVSGGH